MSEDLTFAGVIGQAAAVRDGRTTAAKLLDDTLARIGALDPRFNAFSLVMADRARAEAADRDATPAAERGPLHGVPIAVKEEIDVEGAVTTFGGRGNSTPAAADSEMVRRLRQAGAVIVGKTCMPEFGQWPYTESLATGLTRNPYDAERTPGGSSGGSAVAVASGMVAAALGGDGGGSIRVPASCCHLFGLKPSRGRVSSAPMEHLWYSLGTAGPLTRTVLDSAVIYDVISGSMPGDRFTAPPLTTSLADAAGKDPGRLRIGWSTKTVTPGIKPDKEVVAAVERTAMCLSELGHDVSPIDVHYPDPTLPFLALWFAGVRAEAFAVEHFERLERRTRQTVRLGGWVRESVIERALRAGDKVATKANRIFDRVDVLLTPTIAPLPGRLPRLGRGGTPAALVRTLPMVTYTALWNMTGNPAASVPAGLSRGGLPIGVQLVGRLYDEPTLVSLAAQLEAATGWAETRPGEVSPGDG